MEGSNIISAPDTSRQRARVSTAQESGGSPCLRPSVLGSVIKPNCTAGNSDPEELIILTPPPTGQAERGSTDNSEADTGSKKATRASNRSSTTKKTIASKKKAPAVRKRKNSEPNHSREDNKKSKMDEEFRAFMMEMRASMKEMPTKDQFTNFERTITTNTTNIRENRAAIDEHEKQLRSLRESIQRIEHEQTAARRGLAGRIEQAVGGVREIERMDEQKNEYDIARRSARIWPIVGDDEEQMKAGVEAFISGALLLDSEQVQVVSVTRAENENGYGSFVYDEVVVVFTNAAQRDRVMMSGPKLSGYVDEDKKPTCGLRQEIPAHLLPSFKVLHKYGINLKKRLGTNMKKHIKFDDYTRSLFIQIKTDTDGNWINITPDEANSSIRRSDEKKRKELRAILSPDGEEPGMLQNTRESPMSVTPSSTNPRQALPRPRWIPKSSGPDRSRGRSTEGTKSGSNANQTWKPPGRKEEKNGRK